MYTHGFSGFKWKNCVYLIPDSVCLIVLAEWVKGTSMLIPSQAVRINFHWETGHCGWWQQSFHKMQPLWVQLMQVNTKKREA